MNTPLRAAALALALVLAGCGSGDGDGINPGVAMHGQDVVITLKGRNLDKPVSVAASTGACTALARSAAEPWVSTPETAYYVCTRTQVGEHRALFIRPSDGVLLGDVAFTVPQPQVTLTVDNGAGVQGQLVLTLEATLVPVTVDNFLAYVRSGFYVGTVFHRVVPGFVVQGLDPRGDGYGTGDASLRSEVNQEMYERGTVGMPDAGKDTGGCQIFVTFRPQPRLDARYTAFGKVVEGMEIVERLDLGDVIERIEIH